MSKPKIEGKFYPLKYDEWLDIWHVLRPSEIAVLMLLRTRSPYGNRISINCSRIAEELGCSRQTVSRAVRSLADKGYIEAEAIEYQVSVLPGGIHSQMWCADTPRCAQTPMVREDPLAVRTDTTAMPETPKTTGIAPPLKEKKDLYIEANSRESSRSDLCELESQEPKDGFMLIANQNSIGTDNELNSGLDKFSAPSPKNYDAALGFPNPEERPLRPGQYPPGPWLEGKKLNAQFVRWQASQWSRSAFSGCSAEFVEGKVRKHYRAGQKGEGCIQDDWDAFISEHHRYFQQVGMRVASGASLDDFERDRILAIAPTIDKGKSDIDPVERPSHLQPLRFLLNAVTTGSENRVRELAGDVLVDSSIPPEQKTLAPEAPKGAENAGAYTRVFTAREIEASLPSIEESREGCRRFMAGLPKHQRDRIEANKRKLAVEKLERQSSRRG